MYLNGEGVAKDKAMALEWLHKAAKQDHPDAYLSLGLASGDANESFNYYLKAAELENTLAQGMVGERYRKGDGVDQDLEKAFEWWLKAAEQLSFQSQYNVACCYAKGEGVTQDLVTAYAWFTIAAPFYGDAEEKLALAEAKMTKEQIAEAQALAKELAKRIGQPSPNSP
jgi:TPR repeat protein